MLRFQVYEPVQQNSSRRGIRVAYRSEPRPRDCRAPQPDRDQGGFFLPRAIADPDDLELFAGQLRQFQQECFDRLAALDGQFQSLSESWQDQEQQRFQGVYDDFVRSFERFIAETEEYVPFLQRKAAHLRDYLSS